MVRLVFVWLAFFLVVGGQVIPHRWRLAGSFSTSDLRLAGAVQTSSSLPFWIWIEFCFLVPSLLYCTSSQGYPGVPVLNCATFPHYLPVETSVAALNADMRRHRLFENIMITFNFYLLNQQYSNSWMFYHIHTRWQYRATIVVTKKTKAYSFVPSSQPSVVLREHFALNFITCFLSKELLP